ncbi:MAG: tRNA preQ1(34) S-adenosylmethionine ribosyltransferase-isomerase QueA [Deltaproteobacteria bacterium]|nr:tRNA preQ1(34) S-adenosylmethionine ribosyltransferase-isomerase QueA [Deltaproteobacteria bacterium]
MQDPSRETGRETDFVEYDLPPSLIAQEPPAERDGGRLLVLGSAGLDDRRVTDLPDLLDPDDLLVLNDSRVMPARCWLDRATGGRVEVLFLEPGPGLVEALVRPSRRLAPGQVLSAEGASVRLIEDLGEGTWRVEALPSPGAVMDRHGHVPLPPYIRRPDRLEDRVRYQTVWADRPGSAAAPTAGLHLSERLLSALAARGVACTRVTLHVGLGTFRPLRPSDLERGELHEEAWTVSEAAAEAVASARARGRRVVAVGTTTARALETATPEGASHPVPGSGRTRLFIRRGYRFRSVDGLLTNFHLPRSSLLHLVAAFAGQERARRAYAHAVDAGYRFYSYGDAMLVL